MINIAVVSYNNEVPTSRISAAFGREGGTLGRGKDNYFILEDPRHLVSRTQAMVKSDGVRHTIVNLSQANPILLNGREIEPEREYELRIGDEIQMGLYLLRAEACHKAVVDIAGAMRSPANAATTAATKERDAVTISALSVSKAASIVQLIPETNGNANPASVAGTASRPLSSTPSPDNASPSASAPQASSQHLPSYPAPVVSADEKTNENADPQALVQAFLNGAGIPSVTLAQGLTPEFMETVGKLLAISVQGAMDLNAQRALVKREVNADVTMVVVRNNNPLKFLPDSQTVLTQMFRKKMPGFMSPAEAMEDAFEDLHAHQLGVVAGMRAAMADMLRRFDPELLEQRVKAGSFIDSMFPANRKGRLWDVYSERFRRISLETQDDSQAPFGRAFLAAYEQEVERVKSEGHNE